MKLEEETKNLQIWQQDQRMLNNDQVYLKQLLDFERTIVQRLNNYDSGSYLEMSRTPVIDFNFTH